MWGVSVYAGLQMPSIKEYLNRSIRLGAKKVFTSLHIPEASKELMNEFFSILDICALAGVFIYADISAGYYSSLPLKQYPNLALRLDFGFSDEKIVELASKHKLILNASTLTKEQATRLQELGLNWSKISVCHNYYPRPETGLSTNIFNERNKLCSSLNLEVDAFIAGNAWRRPPLSACLPTIEKHRNMSPLTAAQECRHLGASCILFGDMATDLELEEISQLQDDTWILPVHWENEKFKSIKNIQHQNRLDPGDGLIRSIASRTIVENPTPENCTLRPKGSVTIDNSLYGRYAGELQITTKDFPADKRVNVIGRVADEGYLVDYIAPNDKWIFYSI